MQKIVRRSASLLAASVVFAASPAASESAWNGFYLGIQGGYETGDLTTDLQINSDDELPGPPVELPGGPIFNPIPSPFPPEDGGDENADNGGGGVGEGCAPGFVEFNGACIPVRPGGDGGPKAFETALPLFEGVGDFTMDGFVGGAHAGYNHVTGPLLLGIEADFEFASKNGNTNVELIQVDAASLGDSFFLPGATGVAHAIKTTQSFQSSLRGKVGWAGERMMVYGTAGVAISTFDQDVGSGVNGKFSSFESFSDTKVGYTVGAGTAYLITKNISLGTEYRFTDYGTLKNALTNSPKQGFLDVAGVQTVDEFQTDLKFHSVRAKLSYHF